MAIFGLDKPPRLVIRNAKKQREALSIFLQLLRIARQFPPQQRTQYYTDIRTAFKKHRVEKNAKKINQHILEAKNAVVNLSTKYRDFVYHNSRDQSTQL